MHEGGGSNNDEYEVGAKAASLKSSISVDNISDISSSISGRNTEEKISEEIDDYHYLPGSVYTRLCGESGEIEDRY